MKISSKILNALFILLLPVAFVSCGANDYAGGGIGGTGISVGKITAFGSVWVNGIEFDTTGAQIIKDGVSVLEVVTDDKVEPPKYLRRGMIVIVRGDFNLDGKTGTASSIEFRDNLEGPISAGSINLVSQTFEVLGQTIKVDGVTVFEGTIEFANLVDGNIVEVSGFVDANGIVHASYISRKSETFESHGSEIELKGIITYDSITGIFAIGSLTIDFSSSGLEDIALNAAYNGLYVEVKSTSAPSDNVLIASSIEIEDEGYEADEGDRIEIEGFVSDVTGLAPNIIFKVKGHLVQVNADTIFIKGSVDNIKPNTKVEVKGAVDANGVLVADKIEIESADVGSDNESGHSDDEEAEE